MTLEQSNFEDYQQDINGIKHVKLTDIQNSIYVKEPNKDWDEVQKEAVLLAAQHGYHIEVTLTPPDVLPTNQGSYVRKVHHTDTLEWWQNTYEKQRIHSMYLNSVEASIGVFTRQLYLAHQQTYNELQKVSSTHLTDYVIKSLLNMMPETVENSSDEPYSTKTRVTYYNKKTETLFTMATEQPYQEKLTEWAESQATKNKYRLTNEDVTNQAFMLKYPHYAEEGDVIKSIPPGAVPANQWLTEHDHEIIEATMESARYDKRTVGNAPYYVLKPWEITDKNRSQFTEIIERQKAHKTQNSVALHLGDLTEAINALGYGYRSKLDVEAVFNWTERDLPWKKAIAMLVQEAGYEVKAVALGYGHFQEQRPSHFLSSDLFLLRPMPSPPQPKLQTKVGEGLMLSTPVYALDRSRQKLIMAICIAPAEAVRAQMAALQMCHRRTTNFRGWNVNGNSPADYVFNSSNLNHANKTLLAISNRQADPNTLRNDEDAYLVDLDMKNAMPAAFIASLNRLVPLPIMEEWADYLWRKARSGALITRLEATVGCWAYRISHEIDPWKELIETGLNTQAIQNPTQKQEATQ